MTKNEFMEKLAKELKARGVADAADIEEEYEQHFAFKLADGYSEEEIAARLGSPAELAAQFDPAPQGTKRRSAALTWLWLGWVDVFFGLFAILLLAFGIDPKNDIHAENLSEDFRSFDVVCYGKLYCRVHLNVYGRHNVYNALAAASAAYVMNVDGEDVTAGLASFTGAGRRMEFKGRFNGADIYDDYAHHPGELHALIDAVKTMGYQRIIIAFQPHTYTRTKALFADFVRELKRVDVAVLAEIYAARESNKIGISSRDLAAEIPGSVYFETLPEVTAFLCGAAREGDIILTVGAGDIYKAGEALLK